jgi:hypothetical protein
MTTYEIGPHDSLAELRRAFERIPCLTEAEVRAMAKRYIGARRVTTWSPLILHPAQFRDMHADLLVTRNPDGLDRYKVTGPAAPPKVQPLRFVHGLALAGWAS